MPGGVFLFFPSRVHDSLVFFHYSSVKSRVSFFYLTKGNKNINTIRKGGRASRRRGRFASYSVLSPFLFFIALRVKDERGKEYFFAALLHDGLGWAAPQRTKKTERGIAASLPGCPSGGPCHSIYFFQTFIRRLGGARYFLFLSPSPSPTPPPGRLLYTHDGIPRLHI